MYNTNIQNSIVLKQASAPIRWNQPNAQTYMQTQEPVTQGSGKNDSFSLNDRSRGFYFGNGGDDTFAYNKLGRLNTSISGGSGEDTLSFEGLKLQDVLQKLLDEKYSFVQEKSGFSLRTQDGQQIQVKDVEKVAFADRTFDLRNEADLRDLIKGLQDKKIRVIDESQSDFDDKCGCSSDQYQSQASPYSTPYNGLTNTRMVTPDGREWQLVSGRSQTNEANYGSFPSDWGMPQTTTQRPRRHRHMRNHRPTYKNAYTRANQMPIQAYSTQPNYYMNSGMTNINSMVSSSASGNGASSSASAMIRIV